MYSYDACFSKVCWVYCSCKAHSICIFWHGKLQAFSWQMEMSQVQELAPRWLMLFCRSGTPCGILYQRSPDSGYNINTMPFGIKTPVAIYQQPNWSSKWRYNLTIYRQTLFNWTHVLAWLQPTWRQHHLPMRGKLPWIWFSIALDMSQNYIMATKNYGEKLPLFYHQIMGLFGDTPKYKLGLAWPPHFLFHRGIFHPGRQWICGRRVCTAFAPVALPDMKSVMFHLWSTCVVQPSNQEEQDELPSVEELKAGTKQRGAGLSLTI